MPARACGSAAAWRLGVRARYGFSDHVLEGPARRRASPRRRHRVELFGARDYRDVGDIAERSTAVNSFAAQEFGSDATDPYDVRGVGAGATLGTWAGVDWSLTAAHEEQGRLTVHATPWHGAYGATLPAWSLTEERLGLDVSRALPATALGDVRVHAQVRGGWYAGRDTTLAERHPDFERAFVEIHAQRKVGADALLLAATAAGVRASSGIPAQEYVFLGGPVSGPGYDYHRFASQLGATGHAEWRLGIPFFGMSLGAFGRAPASATLAPYVHTVYVARSAPFATPANGWYPSAGVGLLVLFDLARFDVARGLRRGAGRWTFSFDVAPALWRVL